MFFRIGGAFAGKATTSLVVNSDDTIIDHTWAWRGRPRRAGIGWNVNTADTGLIVNGDDVLATGLFVEHYQKYEVIWNGERGRTIFFQNEKPYDVPNQAAWMNGQQQRAAPPTRSPHRHHPRGWGRGSYCYFNVNPPSGGPGFEVPNRSGVRFHSVSPCPSATSAPSPTSSTTRAARSPTPPATPPHAKWWPTLTLTPSTSAQYRREPGGHRCNPHRWSPPSCIGTAELRSSRSRDRDPYRAGLRPGTRRCTTWGSPSRRSVGWVAW